MKVPWWLKWRRFKNKFRNLFVDCPKICAKCRGCGDLGIFQPMAGWLLCQRCWGDGLEPPNRIDKSDDPAFFRDVSRPNLR